MQEADYIIVGAGSAGCALANRLSADPSKTVILIEGGPVDKSIYIPIPRGFAKLMGHPVFCYVYPAHRPGTNQMEPQYRGRTLGGSSSINGMIYLRGLLKDYDDWNCPGWGSSDFIRLFREMENHELGASDMRGGDGPLRISTHGYNEPVCEALFEAAGKVGIPTVEDINAANAQCVGYNPRNIWKGRRQSSALAFLHPIKNRPNLHIITEGEVEKVLFEGTRTVGVRLHEKNDVRDIKAGREVILCTGSIRSPKMLQLSGIGPAGLLQSHGIPVLVDSPMVGYNMRDHRMVQLQFDISHASRNHEFSGWRLYKNVLEQMIFGTGLMSRAAYEVGGAFKTRPELEKPDLHIAMGPITHEYDEKKGIHMSRTPGATIGGWQMCPESSGSVTITGSDYRAPVDIKFGYLETELDRRTVIDSVRLFRRIWAQEPLKKFNPVERAPWRGVENDDEILAMAKMASGSPLHPSGSVHMGLAETAPLDVRLRVRGVTGLRVADTSIMPQINSGNPNAPAMAIGLRAGELILEDAAR